MTLKWKFDFGRVENILGKEENAGYHNVFKRPMYYFLTTLTFKQH